MQTNIFWIMSCNYFLINVLLFNILLYTKYYNLKHIFLSRIFSIGFIILFVSTVYLAILVKEIFNYLFFIIWSLEFLFYFKFPGLLLLLEKETEVSEKKLPMFNYSDYILFFILIFYISFFSLNGIIYMNNEDVYQDNFKYIFDMIFNFSTVVFCIIGSLHLFVYFKYVLNKKKKED